MCPDVGSIDAFTEGRARIMEVGGRKIGVVIWDGRPYAVRNVCPHMGAPLCAGSTGPRLVSDQPLGSMDADQDRPVIVCPWHGWAFDLTTGDAVFEENRRTSGRMRVKTYPAEFRDGRVFVDI